MHRLLSNTFPAPVVKDIAAGLVGRGHRYDQVTVLQATSGNQRQSVAISGRGHSYDQVTIAARCGRRTFPNMAGGHVRLHAALRLAGT